MSGSGCDNNDLQMNRDNTGKDHDTKGLGFHEWLSLLGPVALIAGFAIAGKLLGWSEFLSPGRIADVAGKLGWKGPVALAAAAVVTPVFFVPRWPIAFAGGLLYGLVWGSLLANTASTAGAVVHYLMARTMIAPAADRITRRYSSLSRWVSGERAFVGLVLLRAFPFSNFSVTNMLAGALKMPLLTYAAGSFIGMIPSTLLYAAWGKCVKQPSLHFQAAAWIVLAAVIACGLLIRAKFAPAAGGSAGGAQDGQASGHGP